ncbi:MAG: bifunctional phosphoribosylaminoimidazolecarboxamide formyltransferase/IMP cyclohydrolase [Acidobacteriota bacterium]
MTENNENGLRKIRRALISVSDKTGIVDFARELKRFDVEIISTGGTAKALREAGIEVRDVADLTGFPELMEGRVKTLHPKIHGGLLGLRDNPEHQAAMREHGIEPIDMVVINLYPFEETIAREGVTPDEAIEQIDIGGPAMIRSAAKNYKTVAVVVSLEEHQGILEELNRTGGALSLATRSALACKAFQRTCEYDAHVFNYLGAHAAPESFQASCDAMLEEMIAETTPHNALWPMLKLRLNKIGDLRYGENPHQFAALYDRDEHEGVANSELLAGKEMSFNNYVDADAAWQLVCDFEELACAIIKHTNPAGAALGASPIEAYRLALATDPVSAFGGIVAFNRNVDAATASAVTEIFVEVIIAPSYDGDALNILRTKRNLRVLRASEAETDRRLEYKQISGGMLVQTSDQHKLKRKDLKIVTKRAPSEAEVSALLFAWTVAKHTKSNAIIYARDGQTVGVGAGQMSRVDSVKLGAMRAQLPVAGSVLASDAFFPFRDGLDEAAKHGITAVIQPGGSMRDAEVIAAADEHDLSMVFTGIRHFKH